MNEQLIITHVYIHFIGHGMNEYDCFYIDGRVNMYILWLNGSLNPS